MPVCELCTSGITGKSPGLQCSGPCLKFYHAKCVDIPKADIGRFLMPGVSWSCRRCRVDAGKKRQSIIAAEEDESDSSTTSLDVLKEIRRDVKLLNSKYESLLDSVNFCSDKVTAFESIVAKLNEKVSIIEKLTKENTELKSVVDNLSNRLEAVDQQARANNIEMQGIPEKENENLLSIIKTIGENIGCPIEPTEVDTVFRAAHRESSDKPRSIIIKLLSKQKRDNILSAAKLKRRSSDSISRGLKVDNISKELYINEHLTPKNKLILKKSKEMARSKNYKYIWVRNGVVFARSNDRSRVIKILNENDVNKIN